MRQEKRVTNQIQELDGQIRHMQGRHDNRERERGRGTEESSSKGGGLCADSHVPLPRSLILSPSASPALAGSEDDRSLPNLI